MTRFEEFAGRKTREAASARLETLTTLVDRRGERCMREVGNAWTRAHYGGDFDVVVPPEGKTALSLVFVQSKDGNTGGNPAALGGGATDLHLIFEGLSRVAADAVLSGAGTIYRDAFFSVWHPELVALRRELGLPRHPAQIVVSKDGRLNFDALLFNVPDVPVFVIAGGTCESRCAASFAARPWIRRIPLASADVASALDRLRVENGIRRISTIGGRFTASRLIDAGLAQDVYLTTTSREAGEPGTPWYAGKMPPALDLVTRKQWLDRGAPVVFEHLLIAKPQSR